jgi:hypothetical protein
MGFNNLPVFSEGISPEAARRAQLKVCETAGNVDRAQEILGMLGLLPVEEPVDKPQYYELCTRQKHRLTPDNTVNGARGGRKCVACNKAPVVVEVVAPPGYNQNQQLCRNGHFKETAGYHTRKNGQRECKQCWKNRRDRENEARNAKVIGPRRKKCVNGHLWADENTLYQANGKRACTICLNKGA